MVSFSHTAAALAVLLLLLPGCVGKGRFNTLAAERDSVAAERDSLAERAATLQQSLDATRAEREEALASLAATEAQVQELEATYGSLVDELESELASGQIKIKQLADGIQLNLSQEILFPSGSSELDGTGRDVISRVAGQIQQERAIISVEGHTDNVPISGALKQRYPTNWELAGARASSVVRLLTEKGVKPETVRAVSRGPFEPVASNKTEEGRAQNRRIEIILRPATTAPAKAGRS